MLATASARAGPTSAVVLIAGASLLVGYLAITRPQVAILLAATPAVLFLIARPSWAAALGVLLVPVLHSVVGSEGGSVVVSPSDAVFLLTAIGIFPLLLLVPEWHARLPAMRTLFLFSLPWLAWLLVILAAHSSVHSAFKTMTAIEVTVFPVLIGACVLDKERARWALYGYLASAGVLAMLWIGGGPSSFAGNKNAAGQHLAIAVLLTIVLARGRIRGYAVVPLFVVGILFASSRGAIVGLAFGIIALLALRGLGSWRRTALATVALSAIVLIGYNAVPLKVQARVQAIFTASDRVTGVGSAVEQSTAYNLSLRKAYREDALRIVQENPILGVGTGNYHAGTGPTISSDPHNVLLRTAAEGGIPDTAAFLFMIGGTGLLLVRRLGRNPWAGAAIAIQVATLTHATVDVYFTRGIPVLSWLLVGMALNPKLDSTQKQ